MNKTIAKLQERIEELVSENEAWKKEAERWRDEAREVLREIRDNEVNPEDEADKFLRDHVPSELSKVREQRDAVTLRLGNTQERMFDAEMQRDRLAGACRLLMVIVGPLESTIWATDEQIDRAYNAAEAALATLNQPNL